MKTAGEAKPRRGRRRLMLGRPTRPCALFEFVQKGRGVKTAPTARGFTLLELTIALTLLALLSAVLFGSLRLAGRSTDGGDAKVQAAASMRLAQEFLRTNLEAQHPLRMRKIVDSPLLFSGTRNGIVSMKASSAFFSLPQSMMPGASARLITRFSAPVSDGTSVNCWYTMPIPCARASRGVLIDTSRPSSITCPLSAE